MRENPSPEKSGLILFTVAWSMLTLGVSFATGFAAVWGNIDMLEIMVIVGEIMVIVGVILGAILAVTESRKNLK